VDIDADASGRAYELAATRHHAYHSVAITESIFIVEQDPDSGFSAQAAEASIFTQGDTPEQLRENARDAVRCHFPDVATRAKVIRLHHVRDELLAA